LLNVYKRACLASLAATSLDLIATNCFHQLGHDSQPRLFKFFAWEEAKTKAVNGGYTDYPKLAGARLDKMTTAETGRFLVVCALASELYLPTYYNAPSSKDTKLAMDAAHYKVNSQKLFAQLPALPTSPPLSIRHPLPALRVHEASRL
jgi:hypothetical protein